MTWIEVCETLEQICEQARRERLRLDAALSDAIYWRNDAEVNTVYAALIESSLTSLLQASAMKDDRNLDDVEDE